MLNGNDLAGALAGVASVLAMGYPAKHIVVVGNTRRGIHFGRLLARLRERRPQPPRQ